MNARPLVSAVVLNYRTPVQTWECVDALRKQTIGERVQILIVDNHSEDDSIGYLRNRVRMTKAASVIESARNSGYGKGNNLGIEHAAGDYILIINPDNALEPQGLERMIAAMESDPGIGILAPRLLFDDGTVRDSARAFPQISDLIIKRTALRRLFPKRMKHYLHQGTADGVLQDVDWVAGACLLMKRNFFRELGGFDPRFFLFFEDTDLCRRTWNVGKRVVYFTGATARDSRHRLSEGGVLSVFTSKAMRIHLQSAVRYFWKWRMYTGRKPAP